MSIARRIAPLGWHTVASIEAARLPELQGFLTDHALLAQMLLDHGTAPDGRRLLLSAETVGLMCMPGGQPIQAQRHIEAAMIDAVVH